MIIDYWLLIFRNIDLFMWVLCDLSWYPSPVLIVLIWLVVSCLWIFWFWLITPCSHQLFFCLILTWSLPDLFANLTLVIDLVYVFDYDSALSLFANKSRFHSIVHLGPHSFFTASHPVTMCCIRLYQRVDMCCIRLYQRVDMCCIRLYQRVDMCCIRG